MKDPTNAINIRLFDARLAAKLGVNHAIVLQQIIFWCNSNRQQNSQYHYIDNQWWTYNTYEEWQKNNFPWLSVSSVKRIIKQLEAGGYVIFIQPNRAKGDMTKWYAPNTEAINAIIGDTPSDQNSPPPSDQNDPMHGTKIVHSHIQRLNTDISPASADGIENPPHDLSAKQTPEQSQDSEQPKQQEGARRARAKDEVFEAVCVGSFGAPYTELGAGTLSRVRGVVKVLRQLMPDVTGEMVAAGYAHYKSLYKDAIPPKSPEKIASYIEAAQAQQANRPARKLVDLGAL